MHLYETTFVVNPESDDSVIDEQVKAVSQLIASNGGKIVREDRMGTRRLAYPIKKHFQGYYATFLFEAEPKVLRALDRHMKLGEAYIRHLTIRFEGDPDKVYGDKSERIPRPYARVSRPHKKAEDKDSSSVIEPRSQSEPKKTTPPPKKSDKPESVPEAAATVRTDDEPSTESESGQEEL